MKTKKISKTKQKIKDCSIELFNESDTLSVTTNHIAKKAKISPGNLYYHYKNKEDIIIDIYKDMSYTFESLNSFEKILTSLNPIKELSQMYDIYGELFWEYRFLMRDINVLIALYPDLKEIFLKKQSIRIEQIENLIKYFISLDIFEQTTKEEINLRARMNWFVSSYWHFFSISTGKNIDVAIKETKQIIFKMNINPFLTEKGKKMIEN